MERKSKVDLISVEGFKILISTNNSINDVLVSLGYKNKSGAMHNKVKERIIKDGLCTKHMGRITLGLSKNANTKTPINEILVENSTYQNRTCLKKRIITEGILDYKCVKCDNYGEWLGQPISLHLDHINGINNDHRIENLRFLCPNCHSQTETYSGKNQGKYV